MYGHGRSPTRLAPEVDAVGEATVVKWVPASSLHEDIEAPENRNPSRLEKEKSNTKITSSEA